jgi:hypothetical protein
MHERKCGLVAISLAAVKGSMLWLRAMNTSDLDRIEKTLGIKLPAPYRQWILKMVANPDDYPHYSEMCLDADEVIEWNEELRRGEITEGWLPHLYCFGAYEGGRFFFDPADLGKGVFLMTDCTDGMDGAPFDPEDYSACRVESFEDLSQPEV